MAGRFEVLKVPHRRIWLVLMDGRILDAYDNAELARAYVAYANRGER